MTLKEKYPDTRTFHNYNANPKNKITGDCLIRALSVALDEPYEILYTKLFKFSLKCGYMLDCKQCYAKYLQSQGWVKHKQPRKWYDNRKYTGEEFCKEIQEGRVWDNADMSRIIAHIGGHHAVAIIDGKVWDTWDSTDGCIGNYWTKE